MAEDAKGVPDAGFRRLHHTTGSSWLVSNNPVAGAVGMWETPEANAEAFSKAGGWPTSDPRESPQAVNVDRTTTGGAPLSRAFPDVGSLTARRRILYHPPTFFITLSSDCRHRHANRHTRK